MTETPRPQRGRNWAGVRSEAIRGPILLTGGSIGAQLLTGVAGALLARDGGTFAFGVVTTILGVVALTADLCDFGVSTHISRQLASGQLTRHGAVRRMLARTPVYATVAIVVVAIVTAIAGGRVGLLCLGGAAYLVVAGVFTGLLALLRASGKYFFSAVLTILDRVVVLGVVTVASLVAGVQPLVFIFGMAGGSAVGASIALGYLGFQRDTEGRHESLRAMYKSARHLGISNLATDLTFLEAPLVSAGAGLGAAGQYGAAARLATPLFFPALSSASVVFRRVASDGAPRRRVPSALREQRWLLSLQIVAIAAFAGAGGLLMPLVFGDAFRGTAVHTFQILCATSAIQALTAPVYSSLLAIRAERRAAVCQWIVVPSGLLGTFLGGVAGGAVPAAGAGLIALSVQLVWLGSILRSEIRNGDDDPEGAGLGGDADPLADQLPAL